MQAKEETKRLRLNLDAGSKRLYVKLPIQRCPKPPPSPAKKIRLTTLSTLQTASKVNATTDKVVAAIGENNKL